MSRPSTPTSNRFPSLVGGTSPARTLSGSSPPRTISRGSHISPQLRGYRKYTLPDISVEHYGSSRQQGLSNLFDTPDNIKLDWPPPAIVESGVRDQHQESWRTFLPSITPGQFSDKLMDYVETPKPSQPQNSPGSSNRSNVENRGPGGGRQYSPDSPVRRVLFQSPAVDSSPNPGQICSMYEKSADNIDNLRSMHPYNSLGSDNVRRVVYYSTTADDNPPADAIRSPHVTQRKNRGEGRYTSKSQQFEGIGATPTNRSISTYNITPDSSPDALQLCNKSSANRRTVSFDDDYVNDKPSGMSQRYKSNQTPISKSNNFGWTMRPVPPSPLTKNPVATKEDSIPKVKGRREVGNIRPQSAFGHRELPGAGNGRQSEFLAIPNQKERPRSSASSMREPGTTDHRTANYLLGEQVPASPTRSRLPVPSSWKADYMRPTTSSRCKSSLSSIRPELLPRPQTSIGLRSAKNHDSSTAAPKSRSRSVAPSSRSSQEQAAVSTRLATRTPVRIQEPPRVVRIRRAITPPSRQFKVIRTGPENVLARLSAPTAASRARSQVAIRKPVLSLRTRVAAAIEAVDIIERYCLMKVHIEDVNGIRSDLEMVHNQKQLDGIVSKIEKLEWVLDGEREEERVGGLLKAAVGK